MSPRALRIHGGQVDLAMRLYPDAPRPFLDLSTGINPVGYPVPPIDPVSWQRLPLRAEINHLLDYARAFYGVPSRMMIAAVPGSEIALRLLPVLVPAKHVGILGPTYGSHEESWRASGADVVMLDGIEHLPAGLNALVLVNPNNPDGRLLSSDAMLATAHSLAKTGGVLIVDESFGDLAPQQSILYATNVPPNIIVLRSLGKFFGLAGLRAGFVIANANIIARINAIMGDWPVSGPAAMIAARALSDAQWITETRARLAHDRAKLDAILARAKLEIIGGTDLFRFVTGPVHLDDRLARAGILIRAFDHVPTHFRIGLPASDAEGTRLADALGAD